MTDVLDHGYVRLVDSMGGDLSIVNAARTSYDNPSTLHFPACPETATDVVKARSCICAGIIQEINAGGRFLLDDVFDGQEIDTLAKADAGLINFLAEHRHGTPFEMVTLKFEVQAPIFVFREWHRHRIASINEMSGRYVELPRLFYVPDRDNVREQKGKPGAYYYERMDDTETAVRAQDTIERCANIAFHNYELLLADGVAKEQARMVLPVNTYSKMVWSCNLRALFNFLSLRNHDRAQYEIKVYAEAMEEMAKAVAPVALQAFIDNERIAP